MKHYNELLVEALIWFAAAAWFWGFGLIIYFEYFSEYKLFGFF